MILCFVWISECFCPAIALESTISKCCDSRYRYIGSPATLFHRLPVLTLSPTCVCTYVATPLHASSCSISCIMYNFTSTQGAWVTVVNQTLQFPLYNVPKHSSLFIRRCVCCVLPTRMAIFSPLSFPPRSSTPPEISVPWNFQTLVCCRRSPWGCSFCTLLLAYSACIFWGSDSF